MRKHLVTAVLLVALAVTAWCCSGCRGTLEPGGAYAPLDAAGNALVKPDYGFFVTDAAFKLAYAAVDAVFTFELQNERLLWQLSPEIKHTLDRIRPEAVKVRDDYIRARAAYMANPVPANLDQMQTILARMQQLSAAATAVLPRAK